MFRKVLIANRGEIACRIIRTLREMGIGSVAVYSDVDRNALHVRMADQAVSIGEADSGTSYLRTDRILDAARKTQVDAVHPGYGFLSENAAFAEQCEAQRVCFIGPSPGTMRAMASKTSARQLMQRASVPVVPGAHCKTFDDAQTAAETLGYPVLIKAAHGGGGKGMRIVHDPGQLRNAWQRAQSESERSFGSDELYLEKALVGARHVEIQLLADHHGNQVHLFERDCSLQRRHQKVVEQTPCPGIPRELIHQMGQAALRGAKAVNYVSAGTFEFLVDRDNTFYFLEMNTRLQVEHPITEWVTGLDLVREMVRIAAGEPLGLSQQQIQPKGASIECRIYAEDPNNNFIPTPGTIDVLRFATGPGVRIDSGVCVGTTISSDYDPLIAKLSVWAPTREHAIARMQRALRECVIGGIISNLQLLQHLMHHPDFVAGNVDTEFLEKNRQALVEYICDDPTDRQMLAAAVALAIHANHYDQNRTEHPSNDSVDQMGPPPLPIIDPAIDSSPHNPFAQNS